MIETPVQQGSMKPGERLYYVTLFLIKTRSSEMNIAISAGWSKRTFVGYKTRKMN